MRAIIIGAGIGGLTTAIALRQSGVETVIFERADELREVGAGITLWANAMQALGKLGVADAVLAAGAPVAGGQVRSWRGEVLYEVPLGALEEMYGVSVGLHRAYLQAALLSALPDDAVRLGVTCEGFRQDALGVASLFADGREEHGDSSSVRTGSTRWSGRSSSAKKGPSTPATPPGVVLSRQGTLPCGTGRDSSRGVGGR